MSAEMTTRRLRRCFAGMALTGAVSMTGCGKADAPTPAATEEASAPKPPEDPHRLVGYDVRRVRPGAGALAEAFDGALARAQKDGQRPAVLFSADWCEPCRDLEIELGNMHPASAIGDVRIFILKEEEWQKAVRMDEYNGLRTRWDKVINSYPLFVVLDDEGATIEEMQAGRERLESSEVAATLPNWFAGLRAAGWQIPSQG